MPYVHCLTNQDPGTRAEEDFKAGAAAILAEVAAKPENYLFVSVQTGQTLFVRGQREPGAMLEVSLVGSLDKAQKQEITARFCRLCQETLGVPGDGVYVVFHEVAGGNWGWNGRLFG